MKKQKFAIWTLSFLLGAVLMLSFGCEKEEVGASPEISTAEVTEILDYTARCGGSVTTKGGSNIVALGLCWSKDNPEPTVEDTFEPSGDYTKEGILENEWQFEATMKKLEYFTDYYVRAYAANEAGVSYGEVKTFKTLMPERIYHTLTPDMLVTHTQCVWEGPKEALCDGDITTYWHSSYDQDVQPLPHYVQITFSEPKLVGGFAYWHRDAITGGHGRSGNPDQFDVQTSADGTTWETIWTSEPDLPFSIAVDDDTYVEQGNVLTFGGDNVSSKYFRIRVLSNMGDVNWTHFGELKVFEYYPRELK
ncbi:MAG: discoidin domain-containing protein [Bacteroidota bacterium]